MVTDNPLVRDLQEILQEFWPDDEKSVDLAVEFILSRLSGHTCACCERAGCDCLSADSKGAAGE